MKIRAKMLVMTLVLSLALIFSSVFISGNIYSSSIRSRTLSNSQFAAEGMSRELKNVDASEFFKYYLENIQQIYKNNREEIEKYSFSKDISPTDKSLFFTELTADLFPPLNQLGLSYEKAWFMNNYRFMLQNLDLVAKTDNMQEVQVFYYDQETDRLVYLLDTNSEQSLSYHFPASVGTVTDEFFKNTLKDQKPSAYIVGNLCLSSAPIYSTNDELIGYIQFTRMVDDLKESQQSFVWTILLILMISTLILSLLYLLAMDRLVVRNIKKLTVSAEDFTDQLESSEELHKVRTDIVAGDEVGILSSKMELMQDKIMEYISELENKTAQEQRMRAELDLASRIQTESLPAREFNRGNIRLSALIHPAKEVGGDLYDYLMLDDDHLFFVIADVSGKGVPAALFMMRGEEMIRTKIQTRRPIGEVAREVNDSLCERNAEGLFITAFMAVLEISTGHLIYVRAGHEQPFLEHNGEISKISEEPNVVLGLFEDMDFEEGTLELVPGDRLLMYTDGLNEGINSSFEEFGYDRIKDEMAAHHQPVLDRMYESLCTFADGTDQFDDVTMLLLEVNRDENQN